jgi:spermidine/putrescine transport system ATP-binding protein
LAVKILNRIFLGEHTEYRVANDTLGEFMVLSPRKSERGSGTFDIGDTAAAGWRPEAALVLAAT